MIDATTSSPDATRQLAGAVAGLVRGGDIVLLAGELGAGKTCFTQGFGQALGVDEPITSPTFTLLRPYEGRLRLLHSDVYRLEHLQEIIDLGINELIDEEAVAVIEWGDMAEPVIPSDFLEITITYGDSEGEGESDASDAPDPEDGSADDLRHFVFRGVGASWANRAAALQKALVPWAEAP